MYPVWKADHHRCCLCLEVDVACRPPLDGCHISLSWPFVVGLCQWGIGVSCSVPIPSPFSVCGLLAKGVRYTPHAPHDCRLIALDLVHGKQKASLVLNQAFRVVCLVFSLLSVSSLCAASLCYMCSWAYAWSSGVDDVVVHVPCHICCL